MKILTWNINGIRASKVPLKLLFDGLEADIICLQETKVTRDMLDEKTAIIEGYSSYYSFSNVKTGYSGVATYVRENATPVKAEEGLSGTLTTDEDAAIGFYGDHSDFTEEEIIALDKEGRTVVTQHKIESEDGQVKDLAVINVYCPRADPEREDRKIFKIRFYELLQIRAQALLDSGCHVIILGDVNSSHKRIDHCDPEDEVEFAKNPGRQWLDQLLWTPPRAADELKPENESHDQTSANDNVKDTKGVKSLVESYHEASDRSSHQLFVDTYRYFHPNKTQAFTCWNTMKGARETNYGTRIDYIFADKNLALEAFSDCIIMPDVMGSDHCPVKGTLKWSCVPAKKLPSLCTRNFPEFAGVQTKLSSFFTKGSKRPLVESPKAPTEQFSKDTGKSQETSQASLLKSSSFPPPAKKAKLEKNTTGKKQSSLASFFGGPPVRKITQPERECAKLDGGKQTTVNNAPKDAKEVEKTMQNKEVEKTMQNKPKGASAAWKNLLKGPPPAPLCKGHGEPCLLRTVKKEESLNKGRQFYVCPKPEGHKSNPEARCDHFEWVEKKKKTNLAK